MKKLLITGGQGDLSVGIIQALGKKFEVYSPGKTELDVTSESSVASYFSGRAFSVVINNAGTLYSSLLKDSEPNLWIRDVSVNLIGPYLVCRQAVRNNENVKIINISSTAAFSAYKDWTSYCASKAGLMKLTEGMFLDGYDVYTLCPGAISTKLRNGLQIPNDRVMSVEEAVRPVVDVVDGRYDRGDVIFYRKDSLKVNPKF